MTNLLGGSRLLILKQRRTEEKNTDYHQKQTEANLEHSNPVVPCSKELSVQRQGASLNLIERLLVST